MSENVKDKKVYTKVIEYIKDKILKGELKDGDRLPSEREMAEMLDVSRTSTREAIRVLEIIGLIESRRGSGNYITNSFNNSLFQPLSLMFMLQEYSTEDIYQLRESLEIQSCISAIKLISDQDIKALKYIANKMAEVYDEEESLKLDIEFHHIIIDSSNNPLIINMLSVISQLMDKFIKDTRKVILCKEKNRNILINSHMDIAISMENRDAEKTVEAMRNHFKLIREAYSN